MRTSNGRIVVLLVALLGAVGSGAAPAPSEVVLTQEGLDQAIGRLVAAAWGDPAPAWEIARRHPFESLAGYTFRLRSPDALTGGRNWFQLHGEPVDGGAGPGHEPKTFLLPVDLFWSDSVWVAPRGLPAGRKLAPGDLEWRWSRHDQTPEAVRFETPPWGLQLRRGLGAGGVVTGDMLAAPPIVERGQIVRLVYRNGALTVSAQAEALEAGALGADVRVRPLDARRICRGRIQGPEEVEVILP